MPAPKAMKPNLAGGCYHVDVPCSLETQISLLQEAGFAHVELLWHMDRAAVYVAREC
jgi:hypothetical protein